MALNIKDAETDRLARELADETGLTITDAIREAIVAQLSTLRRRKRLEPESDLSAVIARGRSRPVLDDRSEREILGYADDGLPI